jgi:hypothetical protein
VGSRVDKRGRPWISGDPSIRAALCITAAVAAQDGPDIRCLYERLFQRGEREMAALGAMRKPVHTASCAPAKGA